MQSPKEETHDTKYKWGVDVNSETCGYIFNFGGFINFKGVWFSMESR